MHYLTPEDRQEEILKLLQKGGLFHGYVLRRYFGVSERTIQRDIVKLRKAGHSIPLGDVNGYRLRKGRTTA